MRLKTAVAGAGLAIAMMLATTSAHALTFTTTGTTLHALPSTYDLFPQFETVTAGYGVQKADAVNSGLGIDGPANLTFTYYGNEAGYNNDFEFMVGSTLFFNDSSSTGISTEGPFAVLANTPLLSFGFKSNGAELLFNGQGLFNNASMAFAMLSPLRVLILFNDNASVDNDFDDMAILVEATAPNGLPAVPVPAALPLLLGGLAGLVALGRRRKAA